MMLSLLQEAEILHQKATFKYNHYVNAPGEMLVLKKNSRTSGKAREKRLKEKKAPFAKKAASQKIASKQQIISKRKIISKQQIISKKITSKKSSIGRKILITSAIPYVNNVPHLGNIIGCVLSADVYARYCRLKGYDTLYICGTDEHGTATEAKALEEGLTPRQICDKYYAIHKDIYHWFGCSFDTFGRTTSKQHEMTTQGLFLRLYKNGFITHGTLDQLYCTSCKKFLADRFVVGTCPHCQFQQARGDQCDRCGKLLNAVELIQPACKVCRASPIVRTSDHLFLNLQKLQEPLKAWFEKQSVLGHWPQNAVTITKAWFTEGLKPRCITRDLTWGIPVPLRGYEKKVFYVWFDAPIGYISMTQSARKDWTDWWKGSHVELVQFMAKDNIPFHSILFPATLIGADEGHVLAHHLSSTEYLNYENGKFSKTHKTGVFGDDAKFSGIPPDVWRYYLLVNRPEQADTEFSWSDFQQKSNHELLANLGNFVNRTLSFLNKNFNGTVPPAVLTEKDHAFLNGLDGVIARATAHLENVRLKDALREIMQASKLANGYFQENEPWKLLESGRERCGTILHVCVNLVRSLAVLIQPFLPFTSAEMFRQLNLPNLFPKQHGSSRQQGHEGWDSALRLGVKAGHQISTPSPLFRKLEDQEIKLLRQRFSGVQQQAAAAGSNEAKTAGRDGLAAQKDPFSAVDLCVAAVTAARDHPNADKLLVLTVAAGSGSGKQGRQICAGIKKDYAPQQLVGKHIILVRNLKPAKLRGELSEGMLLAAKDASGKLAVLEAPSAKPGDKVLVQGMHIQGMQGKIPAPAGEVEFEQVESLHILLRNGSVLYKEKQLLAAGKGIVVRGMGEGTVG
ncbi:methionine--tRNA ligase [Candidatus Woesearchaeota archaeon]|nr:methionine--tRNA ligase [Candidatus Woesearchaeota archaeon]